MRPPLALAALLATAALAGCAAGPATPTGEPTETRPFPPSPTRPPVPDGTFVAGPMAPDCPDEDGWHYPPMERLTETSNRTWSAPDGAMRVAEATLNESGAAVDLTLAAGDYTAVGWRGSVVDVAERYDTERYAVGRASVSDAGDLNVLVLGYPDRTEVVVYRTLGYC